MELLYIDEINCQRQFDAQYYYYLLNYIFGEKTNMHSYVGFLINVYKHLDIRNNNEIIDFFEFCNIQAVHATDGKEKDIYKDIDNIRNKAKIIYKLKKIKNLSKAGFEAIRQYNEIITECKNYIYQVAEEHIKSLDLNVLVDLYDEDIIKCSFSLLKRDFEIKDREIGEKIYENLKTRQKLFVLDDVFEYAIELHGTETTIPEADEENMEMNMASEVILRFPCSKEISLINIIILRKKVQLLINDVYRKIQEFRIIVSKIKLDNGIKILLEKFSEDIEKDIQILQKEIDDNIYIKGIKNSDANYKEIKIKLGILPYDSVLNLFAIKNIISQKKLSELKFRLKKDLLQDSCEIFLFYEIESNINN